MEPTASRRLNIFNTKDEMNFLRHLWNGININNSWESFVIHAPHSLNALEKLMVYAVRTSTDSGTTLRVRSESSFSYGDPVSTSTPLGVIRDAQLRDRSDSATSKSPSREHFALNNLSTHFIPTNNQISSTKALIIQAVNESREANARAQKAMQTIEKSTDDISSIAARMLKTFQESVPERIQEDIPKEMMNLQDKVNNSAKAVLSIANLFDKAAEYLDASSSNIGRKGFMLVGEVKNFWLAMAAFVGEIEKMIEYSLDSSCVPMFKIMEAQVNEVSNNKAYSMKSKIRQQIYQSTLSVVGFALAVRQLANAYIDFSSKFIIPQINILAGYVLVSNSENELKCERRKFRACNLACRKDVDETVQNNRLMGKRRSILELDLGLNVHLSDVSEALEDALLAIIAFKSNGEIKKLRKPRDLEEVNRQTTYHLLPYCNQCTIGVINCELRSLSATADDEKFHKISSEFISKRAQCRFR